MEEVKSVLSHLVLLNEGQVVLDSSMDELGERYCQVTVKPGQYESAEKLNPIITRELLGCKSMIFEDVERWIRRPCAVLQVNVRHHVEQVAR